MDEIALLRRAREDVAPPEDEVVAAARRRLIVATSRPGRRHVTRPRVAVAAATASLVGLGAALTLWPGGPEPAGAGTALREASTASEQAHDPVAGRGQFLQVETRERAMAYVTGDGATSSVIGGYLSPGVSTTWVPHDRRDTWVRQSYSGPAERYFGGVVVRRAAARDLAESATRSAPVTMRARGGSCDNGELGGGEERFIGTEDLGQLSRDPGQLLDQLSRTQRPAGTSRSTEVMSQVSTLLRSGLVPHDLRAAMYGALALLPGVRITADQASLDGRTGTAIGITSTSGSELDEVIIDTDSGDYLGERQTQLVREGAVPAGTVVDATSVRVRVVDDAP